jgi:FMN phosphatase YigB (HAD superfamily)
VAAPDALVFDLFGTLVFFDDSRVPTIEHAGRRVPMTIEHLPELLAQAGVNLPIADFLRELRTTSDAVAEQKRREHIELHTSVRFERTLVRIGAEAAAAAAAAARMGAMHMDTLAGAVVCPADRQDLLRTLSKSFRLALVSNFDDGATARRILEEHRLAPFFETIVISEEERVRKPSPKIFAAACSRLGVRPAQCLYVGDTLLEDIQGATGAGLEAIWICRDDRRHEGEGASAGALARAILRDVSLLPEWLANAAAAVTAPGGG